MRKPSDALRFTGLATGEGIGAVVAERDAPFADYTRASADAQSHPTPVIHPRRR